MRYLIYMGVTNKQLAYVDAAIHYPGLPDKQLAEMIAATPASVYLWKKNEVLQEMIRTGREREWKDAAAKAQQKMLSLLDSSKDDVALRACIYVLDSNGYKPVENINLNSPQVIRVDIVDDDKLTDT